MDANTHGDPNAKTPSEKVPEFPLDEPKAKTDPVASNTPEKKEVPAKAPEKPVAPEKKPEEPKTTAVVVPKPGTADFVKLLLSKRQAALENFLGDKQNALKFMSSVMNLVGAVPKLLECTTDSLMGSLMTCAGLGLYPSTFSGDCYILPYRLKTGQTIAQFQMGYRGFKTLAFRCGVLKMGTEIVYKNDKYKEVRGTSPHIVHEPVLDGDRGEPYRAYAWAEIKPGVVIFKSMSKPEIMKIKAMSKAKDSGPWVSGDPELWMWQKTVFKQLAKMLPTSERSDQLDRAIQIDNVNERGGHVEASPESDSEVTVVDVPFDDQDSKVEAGKSRKEALRKKSTK